MTTADQLKELTQKALETNEKIMREEKLRSREMQNNKDEEAFACSNTGEKSQIKFPIETLKINDKILTSTIP
jgi:hypothetical protein